MSKYETTRATALETGVTAGTNTSRETRQEYSAPFGSHSVCPHLITAFTVSGVTPATVGDDPNGVYTKLNPYTAITANQVNQFIKADTDHQFRINQTGSDSAVNWTYVDNDFNPFASGGYVTSNASFTTGIVGEFSDEKLPKNEWKYPQFLFPFGSDIVWGNAVGDVSGMVFSNFVGGDI